MSTHSFADGTASGAQPMSRGQGRARRGRIIVLGDQRLIESVAGATRRPTTFAHHMYDVIGDLVQTGILDAPDAIVASIETLGARAEPFVQAVRRIDPGVELIAITNGSGGPLESTAGFDCTLASPLDAPLLERAILGEHELPPEAPAVEPQRKPAPTPTHVLDEPRPVNDAPLGDVDLVAALMQQPDDVESIALRIIEQETGWVGLRLDESPSATARCARIRCGIDGIDGSGGSEGGDMACGYLIVPCVQPGRTGAPTAAQVQQWADWLAHWLRLSRTLSDLREKAYTDQLTGAYNRRFFDQDLVKALDDARAQRQCVSLLLFDIDDFKMYNDTYGHAAGDEILVETVKLLRSVIRPHDRVCRIGGDEFVVIFHDPQGQRERGSSHPDDIQKIARRFQQQICRHRFPKLSAEARGTLTISGGLATFPWDGADVASLLEQADRNAMLSKRSGKNAITFGPGASDICAGDPGSGAALPDS